MKYRLEAMFPGIQFEVKGEPEDIGWTAPFLPDHRSSQISQSERYNVKNNQKNETPKERRKRQIRNRMVYNDWGLNSFVQMLEYKCVRFGKELSIIDERDTTKTCHVCKRKKDMPLWQRTYRCENCGLVMDRDENSAVNIYERFLARPGPHTL